MTGALDYAGRRVLAPAHDAGGRVVTWRQDGDGRALLTIETDTGERLTNIPAEQVALGEKVDEPAPPGATAAREAADLSDLDVAEVAVAALVATARGERLTPAAIRRLARAVLARRRGA